MIELNKNELTFYCPSCNDKKQQNINILSPGIFYDWEEILSLEFICKICKEYNCLKFNDEETEKITKLSKKGLINIKPYKACRCDIEDIL